MMDSPSVSLRLSRSEANGTLERIKPSSIRQRAVETLRKAIITGTLAPGQRLIEEEICEQLGVSRGPIREALRQLEQEGLVISEAYKSTEVAQISEKEVREILMPVRITLEQFGFTHAVGRLTPSDFDSLRQIVSRMMKAAPRSDVLEMNDLDIAFHEIIMTAANQPHSLQLWRLVLPRVRAYFYKWTPSDVENLTWVAKQHETLLDVLQTGSPEAVQEAIKTHILETGFHGH